MGMLFEDLEFLRLAEWIVWNNWSNKEPTRGMLLWLAIKPDQTYVRKITRKALPLRRLLCLPQHRWPQIGVAFLSELLLIPR